MGKYILKRLLIIIPTVLGVLLIIFTINYFTPGDPAMSALGRNYTEAAYEAKVAEMGLDQPFIVRYVIYVKNIVTSFDLGTSYNTLRPVRTMLLESLQPTLKIGILSTIVTVVVGVLVGVISAVKQYSAIDYISTSLAIFFAAMPGFWLALMCLMFFCIKLQWLPASGLTSWKHYILPVLCLSLSPIAIVLRMTRSSMLDVIHADYIRTARAKGLSERTVIMRHALQNALIPVITVIGMQLSMVVAGSVVIESIFGIPGIGMCMLTAINNSDYPTIQGSVFVLSLFICLINLLTDLAYAVVDPRVRAQYAASGKKKSKAKAAAVVAKEGA
jgi:peptide/nickel transport system permease protein